MGRRRRSGHQASRLQKALSAAGSRRPRLRTGSCSSSSPRADPSRRSLCGCSPSASVTRGRERAASRSGRTSGSTAATPTNRGATSGPAGWLSRCADGVGETPWARGGWTGGSPPELTCRPRRSTPGGCRVPWSPRHVVSLAAIYVIAASTMAMSCSVVPPLTPTPAITLSSLVSGTPPPIAEYLPPETARRG
jgi:hypothetical protein